MKAKPLSAHAFVKLAKKYKADIRGKIITVTPIQSGKANKEVTAQFWIYLDQNKPKPATWEALSTVLVHPGVHVQIMGTRSMNGSGARDGMLRPEYANRLSRVNTKRKQLGLEPYSN